jgi:hypothetical protein
LITYKVENSSSIFGPEPQKSRRDEKIKDDMKHNGSNNDEDAST